MKKIFKIILSYLLITFNTFVFAIENKDENILKIGALLPLTGELKGLGEDMLYAINLALHDIDNPKIKIYPKDSGSKKEKIIQACEEFRNEDINWDKKNIDLVLLGDSFVQGFCVASDKTIDSQISQISNIKYI